MAPSRSPHSGPSKLVIAFDIGTTYSGASYVFLDKGFVPKIKTVGRFLNNRTPGNFKIPSIMYYNHDGTFRGVKGAVDDDETENLHEVRWWKLKVSPKELPETAKEHMTAELPSGKSIQDVFADFIRYLFDSVKAFIEESEHKGKELWGKFAGKIDLILTHPNGWEGREQDHLRKSVVQAKIFAEKEALSRVSFVTEGEASFNFCVAHTSCGESLEPGHKVLVVDAGGGTLDVSSYTVKSTSPLKVEEFHEPKCFFQGAEFVTARAKDHAKLRFENSDFNEQDIAIFAERFDTGLKATFSDNSKPQFVKFGSPRDKDESCGVKGGKLNLPGSQVAEFFEPSIDAIVKAVKEITAETDPTKTLVFLVGGFGASPWLFQEIGREIATQGLELTRPDDQTSKAVAVGAISHYIDHPVISRIVRYTYGTDSFIDYDHSDPEHRSRADKKYLGILGKMVLDVFSPTLVKGTRVLSTDELREKMSTVSPLPPSAGRDLEFPIFRYTGTSKNPQWMDEEPENFKKVTGIPVGTARPKCMACMSPLGFPIFVEDFEIICTFGQTEFKVQVAWMEEGTVEKRTDVKILYDVDEDVQGALVHATLRDP